MASPSIDQVRTLLDDRFPEWKGLALAPVRAAGTQNIVFRLGRDLCVRLPRRLRAASRLRNELRCLPLLADAIGPIEIPMIVAVAEPCPDFAFPWAIYRWIHGEPMAPARQFDLPQAERFIERFLAALRDCGTVGAPLSKLSKALPNLDPAVHQSIAALVGLVDQAKLSARWEESVKRGLGPVRRCWTHGDLLPTNLLVRSGRVSGVIDFGYSGLGDPAIDLLAAWTMFDRGGRERIREHLGYDDATWLRGRGFALHEASAIAAKYREVGGPLRDFALYAISEICLPD